MILIELADIRVGGNALLTGPSAGILRQVYEQAIFASAVARHIRPISVGEFASIPPHPVWLVRVAPNSAVPNTGHV